MQALDDYYKKPKFNVLIHYDKTLEKNTVVCGPAKGSKWEPLKISAKLPLRSCEKSSKKLQWNSFVQHAKLSQLKKNQQGEIIKYNIIQFHRLGLA